MQLIREAPVAVAAVAVPVHVPALVPVAAALVAARKTLMELQLAGVESSIYNL